MIADRKDESVYRERKLKTKGRKEERMKEGKKEVKRLRGHSQ